MKILKCTSLNISAQISVTLTLAPSPCRAHIRSTANRYFSAVREGLLRDPPKDLEDDQSVLTEDLPLKSRTLWSTLAA